MGDDRKPPITPFLFIPQSWVDNGSRPQNGTGWIACQSIFLVDTKAPKLVLAPEIGKSYRAVALVGNAGAAPVETGFAKFLIRAYPEVTLTDPKTAVYSRIPINPDTEPAGRFMDLGSTSLSVEASRSGQDLTWAMSPETWDTSKDSSWQGGLLIASVFDPLQDQARGDFRSWDDRKVGMNVMNPNYSGTWVGDEFRLGDPNKLGTVRVEIEQDWTVTDLGTNGASMPRCSLKFLQIPNIPNRPVINSPVASIDVGVNFEIAHGPSNQVWTAQLKFDGTGTLVMQTLSFGSTDKTIASLTREAAGSASPSFDKGLLVRIRKVIASYWPPQRKLDAEWLYQAISSSLP